MTDRSTNRQTDMRGHREVTLSVNQLGEQKKKLKDGWMKWVHNPCQVAVITNSYENLGLEKKNWQVCTYIIGSVTSP